MDFGNLSVAIVSYLTGIVIVYAYINRNRYTDLALASVALFSFGTSALLAAFGILPGISQVLFNISAILVVVAVFLLVVRVVRGIYNAVRRYYSQK